MTQTASVTHTVTDDDTALALGSGDLPVLATPRLLAWLEEATCKALDLDTPSSEKGRVTSVGTRADIEHLAASAVGTVITTTATVVHTDGRLVKFQVAAQDGSGQLVGSGEVRRVVVDRERFMGRVNRVGD